MLLAKGPSLFVLELAFRGCTVFVGSFAPSLARSYSQTFFRELVEEASHSYLSCLWLVEDILF